MKVKLIVSGACVLLVFAACNMPAASGASAKRAAELEAKVAELQKRNDDLKFKAKLVNDAFGTPLDNFFNHDEFWDNPYDSAQADCARRCIKALTAEREACGEEPDCVKRQQCFQEAMARGSNCQVQCSQIHPPSL